MGPWLFFLGFSFQRQMRARLLVLISLALLGLVALLVHLNTRFDRWSMVHWRAAVEVPGPIARKPLMTERMPLGDAVTALDALWHLPDRFDTVSVEFAVTAAVRAIITNAGPRVFASAVIIGLLASFLLPLWSLTFANEALGRARESRTLTWFLLRPLPRWSMYLAAYLAALPGALLFNLGGYLIFCLLGGAPGRTTLPLFGLPIFLGTLAFIALFQLLSVTFARAGIIGLLYAFFFETIAGNLPGQQKTLSISYYVRCLMLERANAVELSIELSGTRPAVSGATAIVVLLAATVALLAIGMFVFSRKQYVENAAA